MIDLTAIKARETIATKGPWQTKKYPTEGDVVRQITWIDCGVEGHSDCSIAHVGLNHSDERTNADAEFIAHARQDIPLMIAEIERLQRLVGESS